MLAKHVPVFGPRFWAALSVASICGTNTGDFFARVLHLGHIKGLPVLALILVALMLIERRDGSVHEAYYWSAIIVIRTAATNLADLAIADMKLPWVGVIAGLAILLGAAVAFSRVVSRPPNDAANAIDTQRPDSNSIYWVCMLIAGTLGTVLGDFVPSQTALGLGGASIVLSMMLGGVFYFGRRWLLVIGFYWSTIVLIRTAGTAVGDLLARNLGLSFSTALTCLLFVGLLTLWKEPSARPARFEPTTPC
jgi:uncharacterized membrane-anchored protein